MTVNSVTFKDAAELAIFGPVGKFAIDNKEEIGTVVNKTANMIGDTLEIHSMSDAAKLATFGFGGKLLLDNADEIDSAVSKGFDDAFKVESFDDAAELAVFGLGGRTIINSFKNFFFGGGKKEA